MFYNILRTSNLSQKLLESSTRWWAIFNLKNFHLYGKNVYQFHFGKNKVVFSCRRKEYVSVMHLCYKKSAPWLSC